MFEDINLSPITDNSQAIIRAGDAKNTVIFKGCVFRRLEAAGVVCIRYFIFDRLFKNDPHSLNPCQTRFEFRWLHSGQTYTSKTVASMTIFFGIVINPS